MIYMFLSNNPSSGAINLSNLPCFLNKIRIHRLEFPYYIVFCPFMQVNSYKPVCFISQSTLLQMYSLWVSRNKIKDKKSHKNNQNRHALMREKKIINTSLCL